MLCKSLQKLNPIKFQLNGISHTLGELVKEEEENMFIDVRMMLVVNLCGVQKNKESECNYEGNCCCTLNDMCSVWERPDNPRTELMNGVGKNQ